MSLYEAPCYTVFTHICGVAAPNGRVFLLEVSMMYRHNEADQIKTPATAVLGNEEELGLWQFIAFHLAPPT